MDSKQPFIVKSADENTNTISRKSPKETPSSEAEAAFSADSKSCSLDVPSASPFHAIFENSAAPLDYHRGEGRDFTIEEIVVSAVKLCFYYMSLPTSHVILNQFLKFMAFSAKRIVK